VEESGGREKAEVRDGRRASGREKGVWKGYDKGKKERGERIGGEGGGNKRRRGEEGG